MKSTKQGGVPALLPWIHPSTANRFSFPAQSIDLVHVLVDKYVMRVQFLNKASVSKLSLGETGVTIPTPLNSSLNMERYPTLN